MAYGMDRRAYGPWHTRQGLWPMAYTAGPMAYGPWHTRQGVWTAACTAGCVAYTAGAIGHNYNDYTAKQLGLVERQSASQTAYISYWSILLSHLAYNNISAVTY